MWAVALAARLRVLQANFADDDAATRKDFMVQEIERALQGCVPEKRRAKLDALAFRFPSWQQAAAPVVQTGQAPQPEPETPEALLERLLETAPRLSADQHKEFARRLKQAGFSLDAQIEAGADVLKAFRQPPDATFSTERVARVFAILADAVLALDQLVWALWRQVAPKSMFRREAELAKLCGEYLAGSQEVSGTQVMQSLDRTRKLIAAWLGSPGRAGSAFARERSRLMEPSAIEAVERPNTSMVKGIQSLCWSKYRDVLYKEYLSESVLESAFREAVIKAVTDILGGK